MNIEEISHNITSRLAYYRENPEQFGRVLGEVESTLKDIHQERSGKYYDRDTTGLRLVNIPRGEQDPGKRVIGFCVDSEEIPVMGLFSEQLEQYACLLLASRGYDVKKREEK